MLNHDIRAATSEEETAVIHTIALAFASDPMARWSWPDAAQYLAIMPSFIRAFGSEAFAQGSAYITGDKQGAALWLPPGIDPDEERLASIIAETVPDSQQEDVFKVIEKSASFRPAKPHWYLPLIGVDPISQGNGHGSALLKYALQQCDKEGSEAYLESSNPRNIALYQRYGFEICGNIQYGTSPTMVPMLRLPAEV
ncbi:GNAT family N-acetyltransferase [Aliidiomarina minuta]|uniref:GNAT family N-acetyltransferase n=1 Tax=Aliidiomarina minuta TaxID=880057 RepID=A0A432W8U6_9GAMM|nr:N-acetyltransferase [Aliidiomarina minuta]RUO26544.1 GNAT family N-acetyltransferase [Aliidiomarina minuta]